MLMVSAAPTLLHNDWRLDNMALDPADPGRCTAVYDWDMCTRGDPLADLGRRGEPDGLLDGEEVDSAAEHETVDRIVGGEAGDDRSFYTLEAP